MGRAELMRKAALILLLAIIPASCDKQDKGCGDLPMPPAQYMGNKTAARVIWWPAATIDARCKGLGVVTNYPGPLMACTGRDALGWYHVMPQDGVMRDLGCLLIHEDAHLPMNAWPWNHPGVRYQ